MSEQNSITGGENIIEGGGAPVKHQIICGNCGMVYEIRYISEACRYIEGEGYRCMNCNTVLELEATE